MLKDILRATEYREIIIDCSAEKLADFFQQSQQVGLMTFQFSYIATTLVKCKEMKFQNALIYFEWHVTLQDLQTIDLEPYQHGDINITAFRIVDPDKPEVRSVVRQWNNLINTQGARGQNQGFGHSGQQSPYYYGSKDQAYRPHNKKMLSNPVVEDTFQMMKVQFKLLLMQLVKFHKPCFLI